MNARPATPVIVYDGQCGFCRSQVARIQRMDRRDQFEYIPSQSPDLLERFPQLRGEDFNSGMRLVDPEGRVLAGADAVHGIAERLPGWRRLAWLYRVPGLNALGRAVYRWIAANRHRLGRTCEEDACRLPPTGGRKQP